MKQKRRLIYQINAARHTMMKFLEAGCQEQLGISVVQLTALMVLNENNGCPMKQLAHALMIDKSAVTGLTKRMLANDLIIKKTNAADSRSNLIFSTELGRSKLFQGLGLLKTVNTSINQGFSEDELETVSRFLQHITTQFNQEE